MNTMATTDLLTMSMEVQAIPFDIFDNGKAVSVLGAIDS